MSKCDISINPTQTHYKMGDTIKGEVKVEVNKECKCDALKIKKFWQTHGKGNRTRGKADELVLFTGTWQPGVYVYEFSFKLVKGPLTHHGHYINIDWYLNARADVPWSTDSKKEIDFIVEKGVDPIESDSENHYRTQYNKYKKSPANTGLFKPFPLIFIFLGIAAIYFEWAFIIGALFIIAGSVIYYQLIQSSLAEKKLGEVKCDVNGEEYRAGDTLSASISFTPKKNININKVIAKLTGKEMVVSGSGTRESRYTNIIFENKVVLVGPGDYQKDFPVQKKCRFELPVDAAASFYTDDNKIVWSVDFEVDIPKWPDWINEVPIRVLS